ncbi:MAG: molybdopterin dinucleotide binding domain-containing protein, partial [Acidobacteriota bacterium]
GREPYRYVSPRSRVPLLALLSPASSRSINSTLAEWSYPELAITLSPRDAADRDIEDGHRVRVFNEWGEVVCRARVSDRLREGVALMPKGAWRKASLNGYTATALTPAHVNEVGGGACFNDARVEVERASSEQVRDEGS